MKKLIILVLCLILTTDFTYVYGQNDLKLLGKLLTGYDSRAMPMENGKPVNVKVDAYIHYMKVNSYDMEITFQMYLRQRWSDFRLRYNESDAPVPKTLLFKGSNLIWTPDTFFVNSITMNSKYTLLQPNEFIRINPDGNVVYSTELTITSSCPMDLQFFPFDRQHCELYLESFKHTANELTLEWRSENVTYTPDLSIPMFKFVNSKTKTKSIQLSTGMYTRLSFGVDLQRNAGYYMLYWYIPTMLLVLVSFLSFWLNVKKILIRLVIPLLSLITLCRFIFDLNVSISKTGDMKAIDIWWFWCLIFICCNLIQLALIDFFLRKEMKSYGKDDAEQVECLRKRSFSECGHLQLKASFKPGLANKINFWSGLLFPVMFLLMNIIYFSVYM